MFFVFITIEIMLVVIGCPGRQALLYHGVYPSLESRYASLQYDVTRKFVVHTLKHPLTDSPLLPIQLTKWSQQSPLLDSTR